MQQECDVLIIGGGVVGLALAYRLKLRQPELSIALVEKETAVARHASGRNSGVLHAGFYYTADSLKAQLTIRGNRLMKEFCRAQGLKIEECGKLVVARNEEELKQLDVLEERGRKNGSDVRLISAEEALKIDPNTFTVKKALFSPHTASVDPVQVCQALEKELRRLGVAVHLQAPYQGRAGDHRVRAGGQVFHYRKRLVNCAGLYADRIAHEFGLGKRYAIVPFRGRYWEYVGDSAQVVRTHIYPVPDLRNPFLGVHFTRKVNGGLKIGPTSTPALWREHYSGLKNFSLRDFFEIVLIELKMFWRNVAGFRRLAWEEIKKYRRHYFVNLAAGLVRQVNLGAFRKPAPTGIRAQLVDRKTLQLVQDFVVEANEESIHVLNAVSPAFTCSLAFADYVLDQYFNGPRNHSSAALENKPANV